MYIHIDIIFFSYWSYASSNMAISIFVGGLRLVEDHAYSLLKTPVVTHPGTRDA